MTLKCIHCGSLDDRHFGHCPVFLGLVGAGDRDAAIAAKDAEIERLRNKLNTDSQNFQIECQKAEIAALRERCERLLQDRLDYAGVTTTEGMNASEWVWRTGKAEREAKELREQCGRLANEVKAWRQAWRRCDIIAHPDGKKAIDSTIGTSLNRINGSQLAVDAHNDLQPDAGEESSDG